MAATAQQPQSPVEKLAFALVYAENTDATVDFYKQYLGFVADPEMKMPGDQVFGSIGPVGLWIGGGYKRANLGENDTRATAMLRVRSSGELFKRLKDGGVKLFQDAPMKMKADAHWFQFADPNGNIWDVLGGE